MEDYFKILNISRTASQQEIKQAYRNLIKKYHPDNCPEDEDFAKSQIYKISEAYAVLSNNCSREAYLNQDISTENLFEEILRYCQNDKKLQKEIYEILEEILRKNLKVTFSVVEPERQTIITDNIVEKLDKVKKYNVEDGEVPICDEIHGILDFDRLSVGQMRFYNYFKKMVRNQQLNNMNMDVAQKYNYSTLFSCEIISGEGVSDADEGIQCLIHMKYDRSWIYSYWLTTNNSLTFEMLNEKLLQNGMFKFEIERTKLDENDIEDVFNYVTERTSCTNYVYSEGRFCKKSDENVLIYKKCLITVLERLIKIFHEHGKNFLEYILHVRYREEVVSMYMWKNLPFEGKFDVPLSLKEQKTGIYYWYESGKWYCNRPFSNLSLCVFLVKAVENPLRKKSKIYSLLKDNYDGYTAQNIEPEYNLTEFMSIEEIKGIINEVVEVIWAAHYN